MQITFYIFNMGDVDDVDVYVGQHLYEWQQTEHGQWVMDHAEDLTYHTQTDQNFWGYDVAVTGRITDPKKQTEYFLRWPKKES